MVMSHNPYLWSIMLLAVGTVVFVDWLPLLRLVSRELSHGSQSRHWCCCCGRMVPFQPGVFPKLIRDCLSHKGCY